MIPKEFDAVKLMRELRDQLSQKYAHLSIQEEMADLQKNLPPMKWQQRGSRKQFKAYGDKLK
jgi:uncharacterized protein YutE (UPF0331/DUF86 family)